MHELFNINFVFITAWVGVKVMINIMSILFLKRSVFSLGYFEWLVPLGLLEVQLGPLINLGIN